jgi:hypothetical protein
MIYLLIAMLFLVVNMIGVGHGANTFDFVLYLSFPACLLTGLLESLLGGPALLWFSLCMIFASAQYFFIGYFFDRFFQRRRRLKEKQLS